MVTKYTDDAATQVQPSSISATNQSVGRYYELRDDDPLDLRLDTAFKVIFSQKVFMIDLLNSILNRTEQITDITYQPTESLSPFVMGKKVIFDLKCTLDSGEIIIVEMQYASQDYFKERALYYVARNIDHQLQKWDKEFKDVQTSEEKWEKLKHYRIEPVCGIFITNFSLESERRMMRDVRLTDVLDGNRQFSDKLRMIFLELPSLKRAEDCDTKLKQWLYVINNSKNMEQIPFAKDRPIFQQLAEKAKFAALTPQEQELYELDLRNEIAYWSSIYQAQDRGRAEGEARGEAKGRAEGEAKGRAEGIAEGRAEGIAKGRAEGIAEERLAIALNLKSLGTDALVIQQATGLPLEEINNL